MNLTENIKQFFLRQGFVVISTIGTDGFPHNSCKGIVKIKSNGKIYLIDLYGEKTYENLRNNPNMCIMAVDENEFKGYCLKGKAKEVSEDEIDPEILDDWKEKLHGRITDRIINSVRGKKGHPSHPEASMPQPKHLIIMEASEIIDLTPDHIKNTD
ncbi:MAG: pyridoxamine 5'-phosphate oxidase family protein [Candidatus Aureabacteria bacterium]|nr:pyridoxamine 5'-phosphate oxidase family protein [Candidatus Auribacterota bacterium]MCK5655689.1 pyridoxamine 5'-phosphate oxidase family protein [Candidatus Auribacterota bacterium]